MTSASLIRWPRLPRSVGRLLGRVVLFLAILLLFSSIRDYMSICVLWLDSQERHVVCLVFLLMYTLVAFPLTWGYVLLNLACGYHLGLVLGLVVTAGAASLGISIAHGVMRRFLLPYIVTRVLSSQALRSTIALLESGQAFKVVLISRLTPIPFGLQNALFAVCPMGFWEYIAASAVGLVPTQLLNVYLGTTLRSMKDVLEGRGFDVSNSESLLTSYAVIVVQVVLSVMLMVIVARHAKRELCRNSNPSPSPLILKSLINSSAKNLHLTCAIVVV